MADKIAWVVAHWDTVLGIAIALGALLGGLGKLLPDPYGEWLRRAGMDVAWFVEQVRNWKAPPPAGLLLILAIPVCLSLTACAGSFEIARHGGQVERVNLAAAGVPVTPADRSHCEAVDSRYQVWSALAKGGAALTGSAGLATIPADDQGARIGLAIGAAAVGAFTAAAVAVADGASQEWARECSAP